MEHAWKTKMMCVLLFFVSSMHSVTLGDVITRLPTNQKIVSLTFDACETTTPSYFDEKILSFLIGKQLPFTVFVSGNFALRNKERISQISRLKFVDVENHSLSHIQHMERIRLKDVKHEVLENERILKDITGKKTKYFRFPGGNYDDVTLRFVEYLDYKVVHWTFPSGDPDKRVTPERLKNWVLQKTKPGSILIFHVNGRGYHTGNVLPEIVKELARGGFNFVNLVEGLSNTAGR